ncbi:hypothetical protein CHH51_04555 [Terribacillus saccharophilus]|nr:hypothetical protein CHH51_04555 [Terribacillus saccharophilus]
MARNKKRKKNRPGPSKWQKESIRRYKEESRRKERRTAYIMVPLIAVLVILDVYGYDLFYYYNWNPAILDAIYLIADIVYILLVLAVSCVLIWLLFKLIRFLFKKGLADKNLINIRMVLLILFIGGLSLFLIFLCLHWTVALVQSII